MTKSNSDTVRASFAAYLAQDQQTAERLLADDLVFTSPQDDHIDKAAFLERCFPTAERFASHDILELVPAADRVFVLYEYELKAGGRYRNTEFINGPRRTDRRDPGLLRGASTRCLTGDQWSQPQHEHRSPHESLRQGLICQE